MEAIQFQSSTNQYTIHIDKQAIDQDVVLKVVEWLHTENLARRAGIDDSVVDMADEIKAAWWQQNKHRFIPEGL